MKPLAAHGGAAWDLVWACALAWAVFELVLAIRTGRGTGRDRSFIPLTLSVLGGLLLGVAAARGAPRLALPGPGWWPVAAGIAAFALGLALRAWAVHELGRFFKFTVVVQPDHEVIDSGPYRRIRHPSYAGLILALLGLGIALGNWISVAISPLGALIGFSIRLLREERLLAERLGEPYRAYMQRTRRLVPGVW
jgi:protein-S-isoprenylcysteine O-methyltransferase Ste14